MLGVLIGLAVCYGLANGVHDAGNAIAAPIVTRAMRAPAAIGLSFVFHVAGALLVGRAVAATIGGVIDLHEPDVVAVMVSALVGALAWNLVTLRLGLPCSSGHTLVGALAGAAWANAGAGAVHWGGLEGIRPVGVVGVLIWLSFATIVAVPAAFVVSRATRRVLHRARRNLAVTVRHGEVVTTAALSFAHGSNDGQKTMGLIGLSLVVTGHLSSFAVPFWAAVVAALALAIGTSFGGWRVVATLGSRIFRLSPLDGLTSSATSSSIVFVGSVVGAPLSTTDVVAPSIVGVGAGQRFHHVGWGVVAEIGLSWLVTLPVSALAGAAGILVWRWSR